jgi:hypothetical protein
MVKKYYNKEEIERAMDACAANCDCPTCPFGSISGVDNCGTIVMWTEAPPHYTHPANMNKVQCAETRDALFERLCDPLYLDFLKVKEACDINRR